MQRIGLDISNGVSMRIPLSILCAALYALPAIIAARRKCTDISLIYLLSFFLGWTGIGWVAAMLWAIYGKTEQIGLPAKQG
ncbi:MAG TPA: superinfection immunity protein [Terracidiphilus sp.]|jgi:Superinfection immunity protein